MKNNILLFGSPGSFTHEAALTAFPKAAFSFHPSIAEILQKLQNGEGELGFIPLSNSQSGFVRDTFELLKQKNFKLDSLYSFDPQRPQTPKSLKALRNFQKSNPSLKKIVSFEVRQNLLSLPGLKDIKKIASHPQALWQCSHYLQKHFPHAQRIEWADTATAARDLKNGVLNADTAVIASETAARKYQLQILRKGIENKTSRQKNLTTFLLLQAKTRRREVRERLPKSEQSLSFGLVGYGRFGKLWAECLAPFGDLKIYDKKNNARNVSLAQVLEADFVFLLVPMDQFERTCRDIAPLLPRKTVVVDACSVKQMPVRVMLECLDKNQPFIATHPLFGPDSVRRFGLSGQKIVLSAARCSGAKFRTLKQLFRQMKLEILEIPPADHDRKMAQTQALVHFLGRAFAALQLKDEKIATPDYASLVRINDLVQNDTPELFYGMQNYNRHAAAMRGKLIDALVKLDAAILAAGAPDDLAALRRKIDALDRRIIKTIAERLEVAKKIGAYKKSRKTSIVDRKREGELKKLHTRWSKNVKINPRLTREVFELIIKNARKLQS